MNTESRGAGVWLLAWQEVCIGCVGDALAGGDGRYPTVQQGCVLVGFEAYFTPVLTFSSDRTSSSTERRYQKTMERVRRLSYR